MAMIVQHNLTAMNTNRQLSISTGKLAKSTEKLSSGYRINRAADDAAGLAISEKMRSQIRGLSQASSNAADGISLIQTAEGALSESHSILQRMRELAVQAANGTETDSDRSNIQDEVEQLQEELDRIASDTEFNTMNLLDGSLSGLGHSTSHGPKFGVYDTTIMAFVTSDVAGVSVNTTTSAVLGGESAIWDSTGKVLTINLHDKTTYTQSEITNLVANARQEDSTATGTPAQIEVNFNFGSYTANAATTGNGTVAGQRASHQYDALPDDVLFVGANRILIESNKYGEEYNFHLDIFFDSEKDKEYIKEVNPIEFETDGSLHNAGGIRSTGGYKELHLQAGREYSAADIEKILLENGLDMSVTLSGAIPDEPNTLCVIQDPTPLGGGYTWRGSLVGGRGLGDTDAFLTQPKYGVTGAGHGLILQVGANEGQTISFGIEDMSAASLGVTSSQVNVASQDKASSSISFIDNAIQKVSKQRALLGAVQNRLEHTISNLDNTAENLQSAESTIRDVDMAEEMVTFSKYNILQQAGQSMLTQANQSTQGVLSLIQG